MPAALSKDGTRIAYETTGSGPSLILVDGALCSRAMGPAKGLVRALAGEFSVTAYDRRGRAESGDASQYAPGLEVEDVLALVDAADGDVRLFGQSSGAVVALMAAARSPRIVSVALYEPPLVVDDSRPPVGPEYHDALTAALERDDRSAAVRMFLQLTGMPSMAITALRLTPIWRKLKAVAPTLAYDSVLTYEHQQGRPIGPDAWAAVHQPTLVLAGGKSPRWMQNAAKALAQSLPDGRYVELPGQNHNLRPKVVAPHVQRHLLGAQTVSIT